MSFLSVSARSLDRANSSAKLISPALASETESSANATHTTIRFITTPLRDWKAARCAATRARADCDTSKHNKDEWGWGGDSQIGFSRRSAFIAKRFGYNERWDRLSA